MMFYICTKFPENISKGFRVIIMTKNYKGHKFRKILGGVTVLGLCTSCDDALSLHQIS